ncbi:MAG TPA: TonB family protein, partial [Candidatus Polarisedimenticolaceae bacterium]|nr:TonB family protein [Candidatus Polarisedimenticolaceae bacterium]
LPAPRVELAAGQAPPAKPARLRLTIDAAGAVTDAALQQSCGDPALDAAAAEAARRLTFAPATRSRPGKPEPEPLAVYLDVEARFTAPP